MIAAGEYDQRITLQAPTESQSAIGEVTRTWSDVATVWAKVVTVRGAEFLAAAQAQFRVDLRVRIRWRDGVNNKMRIVWGGQPYAVREVMDGGRRREYIELLCTHGVEDGR